MLYHFLWFPIQFALTGPRSAFSRKSGYDRTTSRRGRVCESAVERFIERSKGCYEVEIHFKLPSTEAAFASQFFTGLVGYPCGRPDEGGTSLFDSATIVICRCG